MNKVNDDIINATRLINKEIGYCYLQDYFMRLYSFSNENLSAYLCKHNYNNKNVLTTGSSGDQVLNLISYNCHDITHLDINPFSKYFFDLKKAAIFGLNRDEYLKFFTNNNTIFNFYNPTLNQHTYQKISKYLPQDSLTFWNAIFNKFDTKTIRKNLFMTGELPKLDLMKNNDYLQDITFSKMRTQLEKVEPIFVTAELSQINPDNYSKYDYIILSNIMDFIYSLPVKTTEEVDEILTYQYKGLLLKIIEMLKEEGTLFFHYLWDCDNAEREYYYLMNKHFNKIDNYKIINIPGSNHIKNESDMVCTYKKVKK